VKTIDVYRTVVAGFDGRAGGVSTTRQLTVH
jgi:hypothetical protein